MARLCFYVLGILFILGQLACVGSAEVLSSQEGRFSVEVPKLPIPQYQWFDNKTNRAWIVSYREQSPPISSLAAAEKMYDFVVQAVVDSTKSKLISQGEIVRANVTGREIVMQGGSSEQPRMTRQQFFLAGDRFYTLTFSGPPGTEKSSEVEAFFASFQMLP
jgi:hypothetical protein